MSCTESTKYTEMKAALLILGIQKATQILTQFIKYEYLLVPKCYLIISLKKKKNVLHLKIQYSVYPRLSGEHLVH